MNSFQHLALTPMRCLRFIFCLFIALFVNSNLILGQTTLQSWTFESISTTNTGTTMIISSETADGGIQISGSIISGVHASSSTVWSDPVGNGSSNSISSNNWAIGDFYQIKGSTSGYSDIQIVWDQTGSSTGPRDFKVQYSTDGSSFTDASGTNSTYMVTTETWTSGSNNANSKRSLDLSLVTALNNQSFIYIRFVCTSSTSISGSTIGTTGTNRVDNLVIQALTVLPIELIKFEAFAKGSTINLNWTTASEKNNDYFVIEKSKDGKLFEELNRISGSGDSFDFITYHSTDESPFKGPNYYRLQQVDYDGSHTYSKVVSVSFAPGKDISVYPTLVGQEIHVGFSGDFSEDANAMVFDQMGRLVKIWKLSGDVQDNPLSVGELDKGIYHLQVRTPGMSKTVKFFKQ